MSIAPAIAERTRRLFLFIRDLPDFHGCAAAARPAKRRRALVGEPVGQLRLALLDFPKRPTQSALAPHRGVHIHGAYGEREEAISMGRPPNFPSASWRAPLRAGV